MTRTITTPKYLYCNWHGSEEDPLMRFFDHEPPYCAWQNKCKERQKINRDRQDPPQDYSTGVDGYALAPQ